jgi:hypothetical protein
MQGRNSWNVSYNTIEFFEKVLSGHTQVKSFERVNDIEFLVAKSSGEVLDVLLLNEYSLGLAAVLKAQKEFPGVEYFVTGANWNGYTPEAKEHGRMNSLGVFNLGEFLGALNLNNPKLFVRKDSNGDPIYAYK